MSPTVDQLVPGGPAVGPLRRHALAAIAAEQAGAVQVMSVGESLAARALPHLADIEVGADGVVRARHTHDGSAVPRFVVDAARLRTIVQTREVEEVRDADWADAVAALAAQHPPAPIAEPATQTPLPDRAVPRPGSWLRGRR